MIEQPNKSALEELFKEVPASSIPTPKEEVSVAKAPVNVTAVNQEAWANKSNRLLNDYKYGEGLARFGDTDLTTRTFFKRLSNAICGTVSNEYQKRGTSAEDLKPLYHILDATLLLLAKEIEKKDLREFEILAIIATLQGFITTYNQPKEIK